MVTMGVYSEYINRRLTFEQISSERKIQLKRISELRKREIIVYAADPTKNNAPTMIFPPDLLQFKDQLTYVTTENIDIIIETPGGVAETVEDMVRLVRSKHEKVGIIIPGTAKSAGTIFSMAGDEILMSESSALGPIDAQIVTNGKRFSADAFLDGLNKIKQEVIDTGKLNPAYIPMLQSISPGEIQHFENAQNFSKTLVTNWLKTYKFKYWETHSSSKLPVTEEDKTSRALQIAEKLCKHSDWLTHGRSIVISDLEGMGLVIEDYSKDAKLNDAIERYYTLLRMTFDMTGIYKIFETCSSQIYQSMGQAAPPSIAIPNKPNKAIANFPCPRCGTLYKIQINLLKNTALEQGAIKYPNDDNFICPKCSAATNISTIRLQLEAQTGLKIEQTL